MYCYSLWLLSQWTVCDFFFFFRHKTLCKSTTSQPRYLLVLKAWFTKNSLQICPFWDLDLVIYVISLKLVRFRPFSESVWNWPLVKRGPSESRVEIVIRNMRCSVGAMWHLLRGPITDFTTAPCWSSFQVLKQPGCWSARPIQAIF